LGQVCWSAQNAVAAVTFDVARQTVFGRGVASDEASLDVRDDSEFHEKMARPEGTILELSCGTSWPFCRKSMFSQGQISGAIRGPSTSFTGNATNRELAFSTSTDVKYGSKKLTPFTSSVQ
jgi:hypothetical protein